MLRVSMFGKVVNCLSETTLKIHPMRSVRLFAISVAVVLITIQTGNGQFPAYNQYTLTGKNTLGYLIGESSGERAFQHIINMAGYAMLRTPEQFTGDFMETEYVVAELQSYGFGNTRVDRFGKSGAWQGVTASLWETSPVIRKIADLTESPLMLASGSADVDAEGELIFVDAAMVAAGMEGVDLKGKIVLTPDRPTAVLAFANQRGAGTVISYYSPRPLENSLMIQASSAGGRGSSQSVSLFFVSPREGEALKKRVSAGERVVIKAGARTTVREAELQVVSCVIEGTEKDAEELIITAHLFEGFVKTGGNDNISGSAAILETARTLKKLIDDGVIERPLRSIRFLWIPEFSGTIPWVKANSGLMERTLCNINLDMVGLALSKYRSFFVLHRTSYGNAHFVGDVVENFFRYTGETNKVNSVVSGSRFFRPITAPTGTDDPFLYQIESASGGSDHMVFNDLGVMVPGIMMITWPDPFYHTSEDLADKCDPTQLKRTVFLTAASAYTIASARSDEALGIAGEVASNSVRRLGIAQSVASDMLSHASAEEFERIVRRASGNIRGTALGEVMIINSVRSLARDDKRLNSAVDRFAESINKMAGEQIAMIQRQAEAIAAMKGFGQPVFRPEASDVAAAGIIPVLTIAPSTLGYGAYQAINGKIPAEKRGGIDMRSIADLQEAVKLVNGKNSLLDIKHILDSQYARETELNALRAFYDALEGIEILSYVKKH
jgi:aminopeptidase YwaD